MVNDFLLIGAGIFICNKTKLQFVNMNFQLLRSCSPEMRPRSKSDVMYVTALKCFPTPRCSDTLRNLMYPSIYDTGCRKGWYNSFENVICHMLVNTEILQTV